VPQLRLLAVIALALAACASPQEPQRATSTSVVKGTVTVAKNGIVHVLECDTRRKLVVGEMASGPHLRLRRRYFELSHDGKEPVLVEMAGTIVTADEVSLLERPSLLEIKPGRCT
jgi:ABC-type uncharacterized transport system auxiliary subunit